MRFPFAIARHVQSAADQVAFDSVSSALWQNPGASAAATHPRTADGIAASDGAKGEPPAAYANARYPSQARKAISCHPATTFAATQHGFAR